MARDATCWFPITCCSTHRVDTGVFSVPAPASEFMYLVAKCVARQQLPIAHLERLQALAALDEHGAQRGFDELFGPTGRSVQDWLTSPPADWATLWPLMRARTRYGPALFKEEARRWVRRIVSPPGLLISVLGPDGVGKSTLNRINRALAGAMLHPPEALQVPPQRVAQPGRARGLHTSRP